MAAVPASGTHQVPGETLRILVRKGLSLSDQNPRFRWDEATFRFDIEASTHCS